MVDANRLRQRPLRLAVGHTRGNSSLFLMGYEGVDDGVSVLKGEGRLEDRSWMCAQPSTRRLTTSMG
jgi:hypothetical protein